MFKKILFITTVLLITNNIQAKESIAEKVKINVLPQYIFTPTKNQSAIVQQTLTAAKKENKLALIVLGAQWCGDSKGLAGKFSTPEMQKILNEKYQVLFVDAGYLDKGYDVVKQFKQPIYYGTPTVMVIEPHSGNLLNKPTMQKWLSANNVPLQEYISYFKHFSTKQEKAPQLSVDMQNYLQQINEFEAKQAIRLAKAYKVVSPLLKAYMESDDKKPPEAFKNTWGTVRKLRYGIQDDIQALIKQAEKNVADKNIKPLNFPAYPAFAWE